MNQIAQIVGSSMGLVLGDRKSASVCTYHLEAARKGSARDVGWPSTLGVFGRQTLAV